ncbi:MAG: MFS transporter [Gemmatimonadetes bacterium]|nr:MFS transporter [Gemmatimonadota bacterium]
MASDDRPGAPVLRGAPGDRPSLVIFLSGLYSFGQLFGAPLWGAMSDRTGRRPVLLATLAANAIANVALAFTDDPWTLALSRLVSGLAAGNISIAYAYVADITPDAERPKALGMLGAAFGSASSSGPRSAASWAAAIPRRPTSRAWRCRPPSCRRWPSSPRSPASRKATAPSTAPSRRRNRVASSGSYSRARRSVSCSR